MAANDRQVGGDHYRTAPVQHWDWAQYLPYPEGCATKYIARHRDKNGLQDIQKALHFIAKILERDYEKELTYTINDIVRSDGS